MGEGIKRTDSAVDMSYEGGSKYFANVNVNELLSGNVDELNEVVKKLIDIDYSNLNSDDKKEIAAMINNLEDFDWGDIEFDLDNKKIGDMLQSIGVENISPKIVGNVVNYADLEGREDVLMFPMVSMMPKDSVNTILRRMDSDTLSYALEGVLNSDMCRAFLGSNKDIVATLFINSDMDILSNKTIGNMLMYADQRGIEVDQDTIIDIFNKKDVDIAECFGDKLTEVLNDVDMSQINFSRELTKDILNKANLKQMDARKLVDMLNRIDIKDISNLSSKELSFDKLDAVIKKIESLGDRRNTKLLGRLKEQERKLASEYTRHLADKYNKSGINIGLKNLIKKGESVTRGEFLDNLKSKKIMSGGSLNILKNIAEYGNKIMGKTDNKNNKSVNDKKQTKDRGI